MRAIIGGTSLMQSSLFEGWEVLSGKTPYGNVIMRAKGNHIFLQRHGSPPLPPHRIDHRSNVWALKELKVDEITAVNSVGSLKRELKPGSFVIPHDFISLWDVPTFSDTEMRFLVPEMDRNARGSLYTLCAEAGMDVTFEGVYIQTRGPRLETRAEIALLKGFGDVVGMTMASEATLCIEAGIPYASLCSIDNYCHGIAEVPLTMEEITLNGHKSLRTIEGLIQRLLATD